MAIAITLTPVRHRRHSQFLTSASYFRGSAHSAQLTTMARPSPAPGKQEPGIECRNFSMNQLSIAVLQLKAVITKQLV